MMTENPLDWVYYWGQNTGKSELLDEFKVNPKKCEKNLFLFEPWEHTWVWGQRSHHGIIFAWRCLLCGSHHRDGWKIMCILGSQSMMGGLSFPSQQSTQLASLDFNFKRKPPFLKSVAIDRVVQMAYTIGPCCVFSFVGSGYLFHDMKVIYSLEVRFTTPSKQ